MLFTFPLPNFQQFMMCLDMSFLVFILLAVHWPSRSVSWCVYQFGEVFARCHITYFCLISFVNQVSFLNYFSALLLALWITWIFSLISSTTSGFYIRFLPIFLGRIFALYSRVPLRDLSHTSCLDLHLERASVLDKMDAHMLHEFFSPLSWLGFRLVLLVKTHGEGLAGRACNWTSSEF